MIVAVPSTNETLESQVSPIFGRSPYFIIAELENSEIKESRAIQNKAITQPSGIGIATAQLIATNKAEAVIANSIGPKAFSILQQFEVKPYQAVPGSIKDNLLKFGQGQLQEMAIGTGVGPGFGGRGFRGRRWGPPGMVP
ncbi:MAG: NifB/NifX family molybdenum-iron cluster-binding protein [Candidatus Diapherotrites archaeon]|nr:NifB/NifX family molybdenum-iron cluster-binding protein [Candidatus Diapherotrites archaeon]